ncbi:MAG: hypothetical protein KKC03_02275 [Bacteroidetes bacterium]|nr:hypothetical protein [Bacteroidota bacterium]
MKKIFLLLFVCIGFLNCSDDDGDSNSLLGVWVWTGSSGGIGGVIETPESTGITMKRPCKNFAHRSMIILGRSV